MPDRLRWPPVRWCFITLDQLRPQATLDEVLFLSSPKVIKRASLGYDGLLACIYWTRAVQYFGYRHHYYAASYNLLAPLLEITTHLDPHLLVAYEFGTSFLAPKPPHRRGRARARDRIDGITAFRTIPTTGSSTTIWASSITWNFKDYKKAAETFARGSQVPNAHPFLRVMAAQMAQHAGDYETARMLWSATYQNSAG